MRIAYYAPLKSPDHPVPSGDRQMARMLKAALELAGNTVELASEFRSFSANPTVESHAAALAEAEHEIARLSALWETGKKPDLWFCYHPYYKAPDLIGPRLSARFAIPYVTAEASYSARRNIGTWAENQARLADTVKSAALNICFTARDRDGLAEIAPQGRFEMLPPFIEVSAFAAPPTGSDPSKLIAVGMMRPGDKMESYRMLARALEMLPHLPWRLSVVGDGACRAEVEAEFSRIAPVRIELLGERRPAEVPNLLRGAGIYVWPGCGEAYGLAYLEAQAAGLPVVAQHIAGVPEVVRDGITGLLTPADDIAALAGAIERLLTNETESLELGAAARRFVFEERSLEAAAKRLAMILPKVRA
ncbi:glycosyltransferase family 4 protein [Mesorhizobium sp. AaZ16]|uniref:glycosyltransferase family 4 protein n=1 Tax=Mesorhizobium sp. AaZ16 TaxID=3402289 RepID=UPI00374EB11A